MLSKDVDDSARQIHRYIRLTELIPPILDMVDEGKIAMRPAVELSYLSFEKSYYEILGRKEHPEPSDECDIMSDNWTENTLHDSEVNDYGGFCWVCKTLDEAKKRALKQYQIVFGYALSHLL